MSKEHRFDQQISGGSIMFGSYEGLDRYLLRGGEYFFMPSLSALKWLGGAEN
jgi:hypothetical protein